MRKKQTQEERVAKQLTDIVKDLTLDLDEVGRYMATNFPTILANRLDVVIESARYEKENQYDREHINPLF
jgi:hypothetical protein